MPETSLRNDEQIRRNIELAYIGLGAFAAKRSVDDNWERIKEKQQTKEPRAEQRKKREEESDAGND